jgi:hypothetical protein
MYPALPAGDYQLVIAANQVTDRAGTPLGTNDIVSRFSLTNAEAWINPQGGAWDDPANWSLGSVPGPTDDVSVTLPGTYQITMPANVEIGSLTLGAASGIQTLQTGTLTLNKASAIGVNGVLNLTTAILKGGLVVNGKLTGSEIDGSGLVSVGASGTFSGGTVNTDLANAGLVEITYGDINGSITTAPGSRLRLLTRGIFAYDTPITIAHGFVNNGIMELGTVGPGIGNPMLIIPTGTLVNAASGIIRSTTDYPAGSWVFHLVCDLDNQGQVITGPHLVIGLP